MQILLEVPVLSLKHRPCLTLQTPQGLQREDCLSRPLQGGKGARVNTVEEAASQEDRGRRGRMGREGVILGPSNEKRKCGSAGMQECRNAGMKECRNAGMQE